VVASAGAGYVEQMALGVIDLLQVRVVGHCFDPLCEGFKW